MSNTVRVRIAVAFDDKGKWSSWGEERFGDSLSLVELGGDGFNRNIHYVEADIPLPESKTIEGEVT